MLLITVGAGAKEAFPAWLAVIVQVPEVTRTKVAPETVQIVVVDDVRDTGRALEAVADNPNGDWSRVRLVGGVKVMVWAVRAAEITTVLATAVAAAKVAFPA